jgi:hypothetical protein
MRALGVLVAVALTACALLVARVPAGGGTLGPAQGALFVGDYQHSAHYCSGSVVHSAGRNLIATAAHCITGNGTGLEFVPGYRNGHAPWGAWRVAAVFVDAAWQTSQDPHHDVAFLRVAANSGRRIESRVHALRLGSAPARRTRITMFGYLAGTNDTALTCTRPTYRTNAHPAYPAINCKGFGGGTSGGPWRTSDGSLVGVTGGYHQGGCSPDTSYSAPFGTATTRLWRRAERGGSGDLVRPAGSDGCQGLP